jgi:3-hydroxyisobutyrate dehydrogenase-like beta-hydroxyacid dehydrogenase
MVSAAGTGRAGFVGLGDIGLPVARCIARGGVPLTVFNRTRSRAEEFDAPGSRVAGSAREVVDEAEIIVTCLAGPAADEAVYLGDDGLLSGDVEGRVFVNLGTVGPTFARRLAAEVMRRGAGYVDAPLMGGNAAAVRGEQVLALGGREQDIERARPVLATFSTAMHLAGEPGTPQIIKLLNNLLYSVTAVALADVVRLGRAAAVDRDLLDLMLRSGSARGFVVDANLSAMLDDATSRRGTLGTIAKDVELAVDTARQLGGVGEVGEATATVLRRALDMGLGGLDVPAIMLAVQRA